MKGKNEKENCWKEGRKKCKKERKNDILRRREGRN